MAHHLSSNQFIHLGQVCPLGILTNQRVLLISNEFYYVSTSFTNSQRVSANSQRGITNARRVLANFAEPVCYMDNNNLNT